MRYTVECSGASIGEVDLPNGHLVAGRLKPHPEYETIAETVRQASEAFIQLGLFGAAATSTASDLSAAHLDALTHAAHLGALTRASRLPLELVAENGARAMTHFVNLLEAPADHRIVVLVSFVDTEEGEAQAVRPSSPRTLDGSIKLE